MSDNVKKVLLAGAGNMAAEYVKVLDALDAEAVIVGNRKESVDVFNEKTGKHAIAGGVAQFLKDNENSFEFAIVAVNVNKLFEVTKQLVNANVKNILVEKPGGLKKSDMDELLKLADERHVNVYIAYNRRFYASVEAAKKIIDEDGGLLSFNFEFTEWAHIMEKLSHPDEVMQRTFLCNSTHAVDLAFYLGGFPKEMKCQRSGGLTWHTAGSVYSGCGVTECDIPFVYQANWEAPGRWSVELLTKQHRLYLRPMEKLQIQNKGSVAIDFCEIDDKIDTDFKAGLYGQTKAFLTGEGVEKLCTLEQQRKHLDVYAQISGEDY
jgi:predicted dehydrogenase